MRGGSLTLRGRPPFLPFSRLLAALRSDLTAPPSVPRATAAGFFLVIAAHSTRPACCDRQARIKPTHWPVLRPIIRPRFSRRSTPCSARTSRSRNHSLPCHNPDSPRRWSGTVDRSRTLHRSMRDMPRLRFRVANGNQAQYFSAEARVIFGDLLQDVLHGGGGVRHHGERIPNRLG
jgi:hypothetical protein